MLSVSLFKVLQQLVGQSYVLELSRSTQRTLEAQGTPELGNNIREILGADSYPHRTRRIMPYQGGYRLSCGDWRIYDGVVDRNVEVHEIRRRSDEPERMYFNNRS
jgi:hypothetical protein